MNSPSPQPPRFLEQLLEWFCSPEVLESLSGDLYELYQRRVEQSGKQKADFYFLLDVVDVCRPFAWKKKLVTPSNQRFMLRNNLKIAWRNLQKNQFFSFVNISGLALGFTFSLLMLLWVQDEMSYDNFHSDSEHIYQTFFNTPTEEGTIETSGNAPYPLYKAYQEEVPGTESAAILEFPTDRILKIGDEQYKAQGVYGSFSTFRIFSFPLIEGTLPETDADPNTIFLSESLAERLFGNNWKGNILGKTVNIDNNFDLVIIGVYEAPPKNSTLQFDYLMNIELKLKHQAWISQWGNWMFNVYIKKAPEARASEIAENALKIYKDTDAFEEGESLFLLPFKDRYLNSKFVAGKPTGGRIEYVRIFFLASLFLLVIACINFINLSTARASRRAKEVGIRKIVGANRTSLVSQFLVEVGLLTLISLCLAVFFAQLLLPTVNDLTGKTLLLDFHQTSFWLILLGITSVIILCSGIYPALILSSFQVGQVLKGHLTPTIKNTHFRKGLVVLQFTLSILLIVGTIIIQKQIHYLKNKNLGLNRDNIIYMNLTQPIQETFASFKEELLRQPGISSIVRTSHAPIDIQNETGGFEWEGKPSDSRQMFKVLFTDHENFEDVFDIEMIQGRFFREELKTDTNALVINEATAKAMGVDNPIGMKVKFWGEEARVVGVTKDFHVNSLYEAIKPLIIANKPENTWSLFLQIEANKTQEALANLEKTYKSFFSQYPLEYQFLDDTYTKLYRSELLMGKLANYFSIIAIFISCLGLFGLVTFAIEEKTKEIGIRKILGASISSIVLLFSRNLLLLVFMALFIAIPTSWYFAKLWLENFAYHIPIQAWVFVIAGATVLLLALITISIRAIQAATANPVETLRTE